MAATFAFDRDAARRFVGTDVAAARLRIEMMERILERAFVIPVLNRPIGLDAILGVIPVAVTQSPAPWVCIWCARPATSGCRN